MSHKAIVAQVASVEEIPGADKIQIGYVLGERVVISKDIPVGYVGVLFPADLQLSEEFCYENNLFRKAEKNKDTTKTGFFEETRRVRAQPFLKVRSEAYFTSLDSLDYTGFKCVHGVGTQFDEMNGHKVCQKYVSKETAIAKGNKATKAAKKNYAPFFDKHVDTEQFKHNIHRINVGDVLFFHSKKHGTSQRVGHLPVLKELPKWKQMVNKLLRTDVFKEKLEYDFVVGTRNVVLKDGDENKIGFHGSEQYRYDILNQLKPHLEKGMTLFLEVVGFVNGKPIMPRHSMRGLKNKEYEKKYGDTITYSYGCKEHEFKYHIYRITKMVVDDTHKEFSQRELEKWCSDRGLPYTLEVHPAVVYDGDKEELAALVEQITERPEVLTEDYSDPTSISEGVIVRVENGKNIPDFYKSKSFAFKVLEGICPDVDTEDAN
jgi:hypothetical protein